MPHCARRGQLLGAQLLWSPSPSLSSTVSISHLEMTGPWSGMSQRHFGVEPLSPERLLCWVRSQPSLGQVVDGHLSGACGCALRCLGLACLAFERISDITVLSWLLLDGFDCCYSEKVPFCVCWSTILCMLVKTWLPWGVWMSGEGWITSVLGCLLRRGQRSRLEGLTLTPRPVPV